MQSQFVVLFGELPVMQVPLNEARDDDETKNHKVHHCKHFGNEGRLTSPQSQQSCGKEAFRISLRKSSVHALFPPLQVQTAPSQLLFFQTIFTSAKPLSGLVPPSPTPTIIAFHGPHQ